LRLLCRVQERGMQDPIAFRSQVDAIAERYAQQWGMNAIAIQAALLSSALCDEPERISLEGPPTSSVQIESTVVGSTDDASPDSEQSSALQSLLQQLPSLPPMVLIVAGL